MRHYQKAVAAMMGLALFGLTACGREGKLQNNANQGGAQTEASSAGQNTGGADNGKLQVITSFGAMTDITAAIAGDKVNIQSMVPTGSEAHDFEPKARDIAALSKASIFVYNGLEMERWAEDAINAAGNQNLIAVKASDGAELLKTTDVQEAHDPSELQEELHDHDDADDHDDKCDHDGKCDHDDTHSHTHSHGQYDPHVWLGLPGAKVAASNIMNALVKADPESKAYYEDNYNQFVSQVDALHQEYTEKFSSLQNKHFVTGHAAFAYLCKEFGLEQNSVEDTFAEGEPTAKELAALVEYCKQNHVKTIFYEDEASPEISRTLASEVGAKVESIDTMESSSGDQGYLNTMAENLKKIYESLA